MTQPTPMLAILKWAMLTLASIGFFAGFTACKRAPNSQVVPPAATKSAGELGATPSPATPVLPAPPPAAATPDTSWHRADFAPGGIIDFHAHLGVSGVPRLRHIMPSNGVVKMINLSGGSGRRGGAGWKYALALADRLPGKIVNFANVDWRGCCGPEWSKREVGRLRFAVTRLGFRGLKISKALGLGATDEEGALVAVDDPRLQPLWAEAARHQLPVSIHVADPRAFWEPLNPQNERYSELSVHPGWSYHGEPVPSWTGLLDAAERMFAANPKTTFVAVHFGNAGEDIERVDKMLDRLPNVHIDTSARVGEFGRHSAERVRAFFIKHSARIVFGTDIGVADDYLMLGSNGAKVPEMSDVQPFYDAHFRYFEGRAKQIEHPSPIQGDWKVDAIGLPEAVLRKIYRENAERLLAAVKPVPAAAAPAEPQAK